MRTLLGLLCLLPAAVFVGGLLYMVVCNHGWLTLLTGAILVVLVVGGILVGTYLLTQ